MMVMSVAMISVMGLECVHILITMIPAMTDCFVMGTTPAVVKVALSTQVIPVLKQNVTPVRRIPTAVLILQEQPVPMMAINVPMMSVMGLECVHIPITMIPAMTGYSAMELMSVAVEAVLFIQVIPVLRQSATPVRKISTAALTH